MAALGPAVVCGMAAAVLAPLLADGYEGAVSLLALQALRLPGAGGFVLVWSWTMFFVVTLLCWALFAAARQR